MYASHSESKKGVRPVFEYVPTEVTRNILIFDMVRNPQDAGRLACVCKAWNKLINDESTTQSVIMHNPKYYTVHLVTAYSKQLNNKLVPAYDQERVEKALHVQAINIDMNEEEGCICAQTICITTASCTVGGLWVGLFGWAGGFHNPFIYTAIPVGFVGGMAFGAVGYYNRNNFKKCLNAFKELGCK